MFTIAVPDWITISLLLSLHLSLTSEGLNQANSYVLQIVKNRFKIYANRRLLDQAIRLDLSHYEPSQFHKMPNVKLPATRTPVKR